MSIPLSTNNLDVAEQVNVLFKSSMGFPSTLETKPWYDETLSNITITKMVKIFL